MKIITPKITAALLLVFLMFGFVNVADAAFAGKKKATNTESATASNIETEVQSPVVIPPVLPAADTNTLLLVILCFLLPPLAVYLKYDDAGTPFIVNLILTIFFWIPGVIHALYHVLK